MILVPRPVLAAIGDHARRTYPQECCGLLVGRREPSPDPAGTVLVTRAEQAENVARADRRRGFEIDPALRFRLMRDLDGRAETIVGHYHSHPDHPALPSARDLDNAFEPDLVWLILSVTATAVGTVRAFLLDRDGGAFREVDLGTVP